MISKKTIIISSFLFFLIISYSFSFEEKKRNIAGYLSSKVYEERNPIDNTFFMNQSGFMLGLILNSDSYDNNSYFGYNTRLGLGLVDYTSAGTGTMQDIPDYHAEVNFYGGIPFLKFNSRITPFGGFGYRYLLNASGLKQSSTGHYGYDRESRYLYIPVGLNYETKPDVKGSYWEFRAEYLYFLFGQQKSYLSQVSSNYPDITNDQEKGSGIKITAKYQFDKQFGLEGYMDYWDIADSKVDRTGNFMEPRNSTAETGIRFVWRY